MKAEMIHIDLYKGWFDAFCEHMVIENPQSTRGITMAVKAFFRSHFASRFNVMCGHENGSEYMADVLVTSFDPRKLIRARSLDLVPGNLDVYLAVESELGGAGASSAYGVMKNVVEDFVKLLVLQAKFRIMVFTSLPYAGEKDHVLNRVETLRQLYTRTSGLGSGVLLIHLDGSQPRSTQVQASAAQEDIRGFLISPDGATVDVL